MKHRMIAASVALSLSMFAGQSLLASPTPKDIKFQLRNDSHATLTLKAGNQQIVLQPGQSRGLKLPAGVQLTNVNSTPAHAAGEVVGTVDSSLSGNTLVLN